MIEKDLGSARIHYLRVIHLYECDLNLLLRLSIREIDQHCKDNHLLNEDSYGGRPGRRSNDPVIIDFAQLEISLCLKSHIYKGFVY